MPLRNRDYGKVADCEYGSCERPRGAPKRSIYAYGCVLCTLHEEMYQKGKISLPHTASPERKQRAGADVLG